MFRHLFIILLLLVTAINISAQKKDFEIEDLYKVKTVGTPVISNDGSRIAFTLTSYDLENASSNTDIYLSDLDGTNQIQLTNNSSADYNPIWDKNDNGVYFISYRSGTAQLHYISAEGGESWQLTNTTLGIESPKLSPDGNYIAFNTQVFPECGADEDCNQKILTAMNEGPVQAHIADSLFVRHWTEYIDGKFSHIILYDLQNGNYTDLTPGYQNSPTFSPGGSDDYEFSPDSKEIVFASKRVPDPESSTNSDLFTVSIDGNNLKNITKENLAYDGHAKYSPNGKYIAYLSQATPGYESDRWELTIYNKASGTSKILTTEIDNWVGNFEWSSNSENIYFTIDEKGYNPLYKSNIETEELELVFDQKSIHGFAVTPDEENILYTYSYVHKPVDIAVYNTDDESHKDITTFNYEIAMRADIRPAEQMWIEGSNGKMIHCFIVKPHGFDPTKTYPLVINVHGGPQMQWRDSFRGDWQIYPGAGYVLAFPNPHGSSGYGQDFTKAISTGWNREVYNDVVKVTDHLSKLPYVDKDRMGAMGWSYGGYFMNLLQAKTNPFKCLASMMGIYDLEQFYLETEELWFPDFDLGGDPWQKKKLYDEMSPSKYVENFATPTLIITGEKDYRISYTQSLRYFTALQKKGIDSRLIIFKNDGHWPSHLNSMPLYYNSHLEWFHKYLGGNKAPYNSKDLVRNLEFNK